MNLLDDFMDLLTGGVYTRVSDAELERTKKAIHSHIRSLGASDRDLTTMITALAVQNRELRARVGVLVKMLVERGIITSEEFATQVDAAKAAQPVAKSSAKLPKPLPKNGRAGK